MKRQVIKWHNKADLGSEKRFGYLELKESFWIFSRTRKYYRVPPSSEFHPHWVTQYGEKVSDSLKNHLNRLTWVGRIDLIVDRFPAAKAFKMLGGSNES